jgi:hypothetical protein
MDPGDKDVVARIIAEPLVPIRGPGGIKVQIAYYGPGCGDLSGQGGT